MQALRRWFSRRFGLEQRHQVLDFQIHPQWKMFIRFKDFEKITELPLEKYVKNPILCPGLMRYDANEAFLAHADVSHSFENPHLRDAVLEGSHTSELPTGLSLRFLTGETTTTKGEFRRVFCAQVNFEGEILPSLYGGGESAGPVRRNNSAIQCWNSDSYAYNDHTLALYQSHP